MASERKVIYVCESFRSTTPNFLGTLFVENVRGRESYKVISAATFPECSFVIPQDLNNDAGSPLGITKECPLTKRLKGFCDMR